MAHTLILKTITAGLENWASDCVDLGQFLDLRTQTNIPGVPPSTFGLGAAYVDPAPGSYGPGTLNTRDVLLSAVAVKLDSVVSLNQSTLASILKGAPAPAQQQVGAAVSERRWTLRDSFDTSDARKKARDDLRSCPASPFPRAGVPWRARYCISTDDPRLKEK